MKNEPGAFLQIKACQAVLLENRKMEQIRFPFLVDFPSRSPILV